VTDMRGFCELKAATLAFSWVTDTWQQLAGGREELVGHLLLQHSMLVMADAAATPHPGPSWRVNKPSNRIVCALRINPIVNRSYGCAGRACMRNGAFRELCVPAGVVGAKARGNPPSERATASWLSTFIVLPRASSRCESALHVVRASRILAQAWGSERTAGAGC
jgi:hypothetical protein